MRRNNLPPVPPIDDQHRTCIRVDYPTAIWAVKPAYGYHSIAEGNTENIDIGGMANANEANVISAIEAALTYTLKQIQNGVEPTTGFGNASFDYTITYLDGIYYVTSIAFFDVSCLNWYITNSLSPNYGQRAWMIMASSDISDPGNVNASYTIQWGFQPWLVNFNI